MVANFKVWDGTTWHPAVKISRWDGAAWVEVVRIRRWTNNGDGTQGWQDVYVKGGTTPPPSPPPSPPPAPPPAITLNVTANPSPVTGSRVGTGVCNADPVTVSVSNGQAPFQYIFTRNSYTAFTAPTITVDPATPNVATFSQDMEGSVPELETGSFKCTVIDANGNQGSCAISVTWNTVATQGTGGAGYKIPRSYDGPGQQTP